MKRKIFVLVLALQTAWVLGTVTQQEYGLRHGRTIILATRPVDPRDPLRGDYVRLNYDISDVPLEKFSPGITGDLPVGTKVFVALAPGTNQFWQVTRAGTQDFAPANNEIRLTGKSAWWWGRNGQSQPIHLVYGIEQYFVAEGTGNPVGKLTVEAAVSGSGQARIKPVYVDGKPYAEVMKERQ